MPRATLSFVIQFCLETSNTSSLSVLLYLTTSKKGTSKCNPALRVLLNFLISQQYTPVFEEQP